MFDRYTENARRVIFFARYEASRFGSSQIDIAHLLLGLLREDVLLQKAMPLAPITSIRREIEAAFPKMQTSTPTSVDMPLSMDCKRVLYRAADESKSLRHEFIDCSHLLLALLREETPGAAELLRKHGIEYESYLQ